MREQTPTISTSGAKRRSTRVAHAVPLIVSWAESRAKTNIEKTATVSVSCHGFQYFCKRRPQKLSSIAFQIIESADDKYKISIEHRGRVAWVRKSRRLDGLYLVGIELEIPLNIWNLDEVPEDWAAFSPQKVEDPVCFLADIERTLHAARTENYYKLLDVESDAPRSEVKRRFYQLARRFHPDHHMDHPEWTPRLVLLMEGLTTAYKTLSDEETKKEYESLLARGSEEKACDSREVPQGYLEKAQECMAEKNFAGSILWLHRAIECEPNSSSLRAMLGRCLSAIPEYRREAVEQFELAIEMDPRNLIAHLYYGELLELLKLPWRARTHYLRVLEIDANHLGAREHLNRLGAGTPRSSSRPSLLGRLTGRR